MEETIESLIIGGGQGGFSVSYLLKQQGVEHLVLEQSAHAGNAWRNDRWDSFTLVSPNWSIRLPGGEYQGDDPHGYMPRDQVVAYFERYVEDNRLPVRYNTRVLSVKLVNSGYRVVTDQGDWRAKNVVIATGLFQKPKIPAYSANLDAGILQVPSGQYRNPQHLPPGSVLVVGSAQSGCQIAEELYRSGRKVFLCTCSAGRIPRFYRGRDAFEWVDITGFLSRTPAQLPSPRARFAGNPHLTGKNGGHTINLHQFYRDGVILLGHLSDIRDGRIFLAPDLKENLDKSDQFEANIIKNIDEYVEKNGIDAPEERLPGLKDGYEAPEILSLDPAAEGIRTVVWAIGYSFDFSLVDLPVLDSAGFPLTERGDTRYPGLYFAGLPWLPGQRSGLLLGVGESAARVVSKMGYTIDG